MPLNIKTFFIMSKYGTYYKNFLFTKNYFNLNCGDFYYPRDEEGNLSWVILNNETDSNYSVYGLNIFARSIKSTEAISPTEVIYLCVIPNDYDFSLEIQDVELTEESDQELLEAIFRVDQNGIKHVKIPRRFIVSETYFKDQTDKTAFAHNYIPYTFFIPPNHSLVLVINNVDIWGDISYDPEQAQYFISINTNPIQYSASVKYKAKL